jgi:hypothetical protein
VYLLHVFLTAIINRLNFKEFMLVINKLEMKYMRRTAGYTWTDHKTNTEIAKKLNATPVLDKIQDYKRKRIQHVNRMPRNRLHGYIKKTTP